MRLPRIGLVRTQESTRTLVRRIEAGTARIRSATLSHQRGRWHVSLSTGEHVPNHRRLDGALRDLRRAQRTCSRRRGPDRRTRVEPSHRWRKARARADRIHTRVANLRRHDTHQLTYKTAWAGARLVVADRWFASSKTCSGCGTAKTKLALSERTYVCTACGTVRTQRHHREVTAR